MERERRDEYYERSIKLTRSATTFYYNNSPQLGVVDETSSHLFFVRTGEDDQCPEEQRSDNN